MLYSVMRPSSLDEPNPVFTRFGGLSKNRTTARNKALACGGRMYETNGHSNTLLADFYIEPEPVAKPSKKAYWAARNHAAVFA